MLFYAQHRDSKGPLLAWYKIIAKTDFASFSALRTTFPSADKVQHLTIFNVGGNKYRLLVAVHYNRKKVYVRHIMTHAEYDKGVWK